MEDGTMDEYPSAEQAARALGYQHSNILRAIKTSGTAYGYDWYL
ncbi:GIY-YIG catalytic domain-containing endonuclease [Acanthocystis turfacea Chlorella virus GM0701.1]|nr:GIY-YIG catalytic domain-containing endonuclease [Acanthocystis turfacea Chlorella virus GM0701.1]